MLSLAALTGKIGDFKSIGRATTTLKKTREFFFKKKGQRTSCEGKNNSEGKKHRIPNKGYRLPSRVVSLKKKGQQEDLKACFLWPLSLIKRHNKQEIIAAQGRETKCCYLFFCMLLPSRVFF